MIGRETVHEIEARTAVAVGVPSDRGGELRAAVEDALGGLPFVRTAAVTSVNGVDSEHGTLRVDVEADVTLHFEQSADAERVEEALADVDPVATVYHFRTHAGPYEIERW